MYTFTKEEQLLPVLKTHSKFFGKNLSNTVELSSGFGIADVVFYKLDKNILRQRKDIFMEPISSFDLIKILTTLNQIPQDTINLTLLQKFIPSSKKQSILTFLLEKEFLIQESNKKLTFRKGMSYNIGLKEVVAIEAKLSNWQRGLYQAYRYKQFANKSYLAVYAKYIHRALSNIDQFKKFNVGLVEVKEDNVVIHSEPVRELTKRNVYSALAYERLLGLQKDFLPRI